MPYIGFIALMRKVQHWLHRSIAPHLQRFSRLFTGFPIILTVWPFFLFFFFRMRSSGIFNKPIRRRQMEISAKQVSRQKASPKKGRQIGSGGQAVVYVGTTPQGETKAFKIYHTVHDREELIGRISRVIKMTPPSESFLLPEKVFSVSVKGKKDKSVGIQMELLSSEFVPLSEIVAWNCSLSTRTLLRIAFNLTLAIEKLHATGMHYCDLSLANVYFHPATAAVRIIDCENITAEPNQFLGTPGCMAPEIANGKAPNSQMTDWLSLAILIFSILVRQNPFHGAKLDSVKCRNFQDEFEHLSRNPIYIFDPIDRTNPLEDGHPSHRLYKAFPTLHRAFEKSFVAGLQQPSCRIAPIEWLELLGKTMARITLCDCGAENVFSSRSGFCWHCQSPLKIFGVLQIKTQFSSRKLVVSENASIYPHHVSLKHRFELSHRIGICKSIDEQNGVPRLKNLSNVEWRIPGSNSKIRPGRSISLQRSQNFLMARNVQASFRRS